MRSRPLALSVIAGVLAATWAVSPLAGSQVPAPQCQQWQECRQLALAARDRGAYETFHDLAWRAIQTGPPNDPALMYLLSRAQSLSGRRRDALIMLRRLADMGVVTDAATEDDLRLTRQLPGWREIELAFERLKVTTPAGAAAPASPAADKPPAVPPAVEALPAAVPAPPPPVSAPIVAPRAALTLDPRPVVDAARLSPGAFVPAGLAYDAVSRRFVFADGPGRRLVVLGEGSSRTADLVRADAAGFHDITALEIDTRRGDLWVTSTAADGNAGAIHKLQLVSGRVLGTFHAPSTTPVRLADVAVSANGTVLLLDAVTPRVLAIRAAGTAVETLMPLVVADAVSIAPADGERVAYVAHGGGILRLDLQARTAAPVTAADGIVLAGFERIRWHRNSLAGVQRLPDGSRGIVVLQMNRAGLAVTAARLIDDSVGAGPAAATISGDDLYYAVVDGRGGGVATGAGMNVLVRRVPLR